MCISNDSLPLSTSDLTQEVKVRMGKDGQSAIPPCTVMQNFDRVVQKYGDKPALHQKIIKSDEKAAEVKWTTWTWKEYRQNVDAFAKALLKLGFQRFDMVNIIGFNAPEWAFANFGAIAAGGVAAGIYTTNKPDACKYVAEHSKAKVMVCDGVEQLIKFYEISHELPDLEALVMWGTQPVPPEAKTKCAVPVYSFAEFLKIGEGVSDADLKARSNDWKPGETCTLIYTSGTTGPPKAAMLTNDNVTWITATALYTLPRETMTPDDVLVSYLPLSHIAAQITDLHTPMTTGYQVYFAQPDALKGTLVQTLKEVRPTAFFGVPRVWEKIYERMQEVAKSNTGIKKMLSTWAKNKAAAHWASKGHGSKTKSPFFYFLAKKLLHKVKVALGLDRCEVFFVGAAPTELKIFKYFASIDIPVLELFGQSENTGPHSVNTLKAFKLGTVGRPILGTENKIDKETGELCYRGRHVFAGYLKMPDKTKEAIDPDGWLHTGDIVTMDNDNDPRIPGNSGFITITGRIKELIITAGGENIPPVLIEDELKHAMPALSNAMVIGDRRKFLTVLLSLKVVVDDDGVPTNQLTGMALDTSKDIGSAATTTDQVRVCSKWKAYFDKGVEQANEKATSHAQRVGKWALLSTDFSEKGGELTPTLKLKRNVTTDKYNDIIEAMYAPKEMLNL